MRPQHTPERVHDGGLYPVLRMVQLSREPMGLLPTTSLFDIYVVKGYPCCHSSHSTPKLSCDRLPQKEPSFLIVLRVHSSSPSPGYLGSALGSRPNVSSSDSVSVVQLALLGPPPRRDPDPGPDWLDPDPDPDWLELDPDPDPARPLSLALL